MILQKQITSTTSPKVFFPLVAKSDYEITLGEMPVCRMVDSSYNIPTINQISASADISETWNPLSLQEPHVIEGLTQIPAYVVSAKYQYSGIRALNFQENTGISLQNTLDSTIDLAIGFKARDLVLHGALPNEGILSQATEIQLSGAWKTLTQGQILEEILQAIATLRGNQKNQFEKVSILLPFALSSYLELALLNTDTYLKSGSTDTITSALVDLVKRGAGCEVTIGYDDTLIDASGNYQMLIVAPLKKYTNGQDGLISQERELLANTIQARSNLEDKQNPVFNDIFSGTQRVRMTAGYLLRENSAVYLTQQLS